MIDVSVYPYRSKESNIDLKKRGLHNDSDHKYHAWDQIIFMDSLNLRKG